MSKGAGATKSLKNTMILGASLALLVATLGLLGYLPGLELLGRVQKNFIPMAPSTAVLFLLQGLILLRLAFYPWKRQLGTLILMVIATLTALFGLLEIPGQLTGLDLNFEDRLVPAAGKLGDIPIARMSSLTGALFFLTGVAVLLLLLRSYSLKERSAHGAGILGSLALVGSFVATLAYMIGTPLLSGQGATVPTALTTAFAFLWLTLAIIAAAGQNSVPLQFFVGPSTQARLMRAFLPIATATILAESLAALYLPRFFPVNPVFIVSITVVSAMVILGVIVSRVSTKVGQAIDQTQEALAKFPAENPFPVLRIAGNGTVLFANSAASPLLDGGDVGQVAPDYWKKLSADVLERGGVRKSVEIEREGKILAFTAVPVPEGNYVNLYGLDITERKEAELALRDSEEQFRLLVSNIKEYAIFSLNPAGLVLSWNQGAERIKGYESNEIIGQHFSRFYTPEDIENGKPEHELKVATESGRYQEEGWRVRKDGSRFWADVVITSLRDDKGTLKGFAKVTRDVTERKRAEEQIQNLAKFPAENPSPVLRIAADGTVLFANSAAQPLLDGGDVGQAAPDYWKKLSAEALKIGEVKKNVEIEHEGKILSFTGVPVPEGDYVNFYGLDVTERKKAEAALHRSHRLLQAVIEESTDPIFAKDVEGRYLLANSATAAALGKSQSEMIGRSDRELIPADAADRMIEADHRVMETEKLEAVEELVGDSTYLAKKWPLRDDEGNVIGILGVARDITKDKEIQAQIENLAKFPAENPYPVLRIAGNGTVLFANEAARPLLEKRDVGQVAPDYWKKLSADVLGKGEVKKNVEIEHEGKILSFTGVPVPEGDYVNLYGLDITERKRAEEQITNLAKFPAENPYPVLRIAGNGTILFANSAARPLLEERDVGQAAPDYWKKLSADTLKSGEVKKNVEIEREDRILSFTGVPVSEGDYVNLYGLDVTERKTAKQFSDALNEINNVINSTLDFDQIMENVVIEATKAIVAEACGILLRENGSWCLHHVYGFPQDLVGTKFTDEELSHIVLAAQTKRPVVVNDALNDTRVDRELTEAYGTKSLLTIPLLVKQEAFGALVFSYQSAPVTFTDPEIDFAEKLGVSLSLAIQNARSHEMTEQSLSDTEALRRISARFTQTLELDEILDTGLREISTALRTKHGCIYIFDATGNLVIKKQEQLSREFLEAKSIISAREGCTGQAFATREVFAPTPEEHDFICEDSKRLLDLDCLAAIPIITKGNVLGVLELFAPVHRRLTDRERRIVMTMVDQLAAALENAGLYSKERNIANTLQETLLTVPEKIEGISFGHLYRSTTAEIGRAGGDFYDLFELEYEKVGVVIGDVSGKGLAASTLTSLVKNTIKAYAYQHKSPGEVIALTNNVVEKASAASMFVTVCFGVLDKQSGVFTYCSAGHPPGILRRRSGKTRVLETKNPIIGVFPDQVFTDDTVTVETGDVLVLYTDGVTEARRQKQLFGEDRLVQVIKDTGDRQPNEVPRFILDGVEKFDKALADDVAILAVSLEEPIPLNVSTLPQQISDKFLNAPTKKAVLESLTLELIEQLDASGAAVMLIDPEGEHLHGEVAKPDDLLPNFKKATVSLSEPLCGPLAVSTKSPVIIDNAHEDPRSKPWLVRYYQAKSLLVVPLMAGDEALGSITIIETKRFRHFDEDEVKLAQLLASQAGSAFKQLEEAA